MNADWKLGDKKAGLSHSKVSYAISDCHDLDIVLNQILDFIINDYVRYWYTSLTNEPEFPQQLHAAMAQLLGELSKRAQRIDWIPFMIEGVPNIVIEHLRIHRRSLERHCGSNPADLIRYFFEEEMEMEKHVCREESNESAFARIYFIQSLRMSTREDELKAVKERIEMFAIKLRGRDSGGDDAYIYPTRCLANTPTVLSLVYRPNEAERKFNVLIVVHEERKSHITTCDSCHKPALDLRDCEHCQDRICSSCYQNHYDKVVALLTESINSISKIRVVFEKIQSKLVKTSSCYSDLEAAIDNASNGLKDACGKTLASAVSQLDESISEYLEGLDRKKGAIANLKTSIQKSFARFDEINKMSMGGLLQFCSELKNLSSLEEDISLTFKDVHEEQNPLGVELSKSYSSLTYLLQSHSLLEEHQGDLSSEIDDEISIDGEASPIACDTKQIFLGGLSPKISRAQLKQHFSRYGIIKNVFISPSRRFGSLTFSTTESALSATAQPVQLIDNMKIAVKPFCRRPKHNLLLRAIDVDYLDLCITYKRYFNTSSAATARFIWDYHIFTLHSSSKNPVVEETSVPGPPKSIADQKKVFVGGILPSTTKSTVEAVLSQLGPIKLLNFLSKRGFAVVLFEQPETADLALSTHWLTIDGKRVELIPYVANIEDRKTIASTKVMSVNSSRNAVNSLAPGPSSSMSPSSSVSLSDLKRIFVGGISAKTTEDMLRSSLSPFGLIEKINIFPIRGYALVTFKSLESAVSAINAHWLSVNNKTVELVPFEFGKKERRYNQRSQSIIPAPSFSSIPEIQESDDQSAEDISKRKLYVEGIETPISEVVLKLYFTRFGAIESCEITGQRACLIFECSKSVEAVLKASPHRLLDHDLKIVPPLSESTRPSQPTADMCMEGINNRKLFIKGLDEGVTYYILREYFSNYGPVKYASVDGTDAWIVFGNAETANLVLNSQPHFIRGHQVSLHRPDVANSHQTDAALGRFQRSPLNTASNVLWKNVLIYLFTIAEKAMAQFFLSNGSRYAVLKSLPGNFRFRLFIDSEPLNGLHSNFRTFCFCNLALSYADKFLFFLPEVHWVSLKRKIPVSRGIVQIDDKKAGLSHSKVSYAISDCHELDIVLNQILDFIINDYVRYWYTSLTNEPEFPQQLHAAMAQLLGELSKRAQRIDWIPFMIEGVPNIVIEHLRIHRRSLERHSEANPADLIRYFFEEEMEMEKHVCREEVCTSREKELDHFRKVVDVLLFAIMPEEDYRLVTVRYLLKEILVNGILLPTVNILADPDFVNQSIINLSNESAFASPYFIQSLRMSTREDELKAVKERIEMFAIKLRGRDSGGDDDTLVKAQLNSLNFLANVCNSQMIGIKQGVPRRSDQRVLESASVGLSSSTADLTFSDVLGNDIAMSNFLEFLTSINEQALFSLYLNCMAYRVNSEELMNSLSSTSTMNEPTANPDEGHVFGSSSGWDDPADDLEPASGGIQELKQEISPEDYEAMGRIRAFGVSMCNLVMRTLPQIPEDVVKRCLRTLTTPLKSLDPNVFIEVEEQLIRLLSSEQCFGAFKRSPYYARTIEVMRSSDVSESTSNPPPSSVEDVPETASYDSHSASSSPVFSRPASTPSNSSSYSPQGSQTRLSSSSSSAPLFADSYIVSVLSGDPLSDSGKMLRDGYVVYTLEVTCLSNISGRKSTWRTHRRYSQFHDLHSCIVEQCGRIPNLKLPGKKAFSSVSAEFIEKRRTDLDEYLQVLCGIDSSGRYPNLHPILVSFLQPETWERKKDLHPGVSSLMNPLKAMGSAIISVPDTLFDGFSKMINRRQPDDRPDIKRTASANSMASRSVLAGDSYTSNLAILDQTDSDNIPFRLLFMLVDEVFSLQRRTQLFRRGTLTILRNIMQTFFGDIMNRRIVEKAKSLISAKQMATYAEMLRDVLWPNVSPTYPAAAKNGNPEEIAIRDDAMKLRTRVLCRAAIFGNIAEELASYLGVETTREGVQRVFDLLQQPCLNRRLVHCLLEGMTRLLLADQATQLNEIYAQDFSRHCN
ncbi:hypothetical protein Aperf_G00000025890 [Anoplocephala perfoliata]